MGPETYFQLIQQGLKFFEITGYVCGAVMIPIALLYIGGALREMARERGVSLSSRLLTAYLNLTRGPARIINPGETDEIKRGDQAKKV